MLYSIKKIRELDKTLKRYCKKCVVKVAETEKVCTFATAFERESR